MPDVEDDVTNSLFSRFYMLKERNFLTKDELIMILKWKSPRPSKHYIKNSEIDVKEITNLAFTTKNENLKVHILTALTGVNIPSASAILMFYDKKIFPVIDIRVWTQLYRAKLVNSNEKGQAFSLKEWEMYLLIIRKLAKELKITARQTEKRLFDYDRITQTKPIYSRKSIT